MNDLNPAGWRPTLSTPRDEAPPATVTGNRALHLEEPSLHELGDAGRSGVDFEPLEGAVLPALGVALRQRPLALPGLSEPETVRHYTRLSRQNYAIDLGPFPLGSCTMKHNPRLNERVARLPGFADVHPLQPVSTVQGALAVIEQLADWLLALTGMRAVAMTPKAGAHGELCGLLAIRAAHEARGDARRVILVPESAHGTNPATAAFAGYQVDTIPANADGRIDVAALSARLGPDVAGVMITNPNTCGLFERDFRQVADAVHAVGGYVYCDGANFNAIVGRVRPGDLGVDAMHINLHKTFSTPHGGGGPGSGPVVLSEALAAYAPLPFVRRGGDFVRPGGDFVRQGDDFVRPGDDFVRPGDDFVRPGGDFVRPGGDGTLELIEDPLLAPTALGRLCAFHGQMGMFTRALTYILSHGADGLHQASGDAVLNANYILRRLESVLDAPFGESGPCMHEALFSDQGFAPGFSTLDLAKGLIDEGFHPMTVYFPLVVHGAMLIEPTETESKAGLDQFITAMESLAGRARAGDPALKAAPIHAPRRRVDETAAARKPRLVWKGA